AAAESRASASGSEGFVVPKPCRRGSVPRYHYLGRLSRAAVRGSPQNPALTVAHCVARVPELGSNSLIAWSSHHFLYATIAYAVSFFAVELEVVPFLVDAPAIVGDH